MMQKHEIRNAKSETISKPRIRIFKSFEFRALNLSRISCLALRAFFISFLLLSPFAVHAQSADELQSKIDQRNQDIANLQKEIAGYQSQIDSLGTQADTLSSTLKSLDLTQKQLAAKIQVSENQIAAKNLEISQLGGQISNKEENIADDDRIIAQSLQVINQNDNASLIEIALRSNSIADSLQSLDQLANVQKGLVDRISSLRTDKASLETSKTKSEQARADLTALSKQLKDQQAIVQSTSKEKSDLLKQTNQSESAYKKLLATKQAQYNAMQQEILQYESQLKLIVNPSSIPKTGTGILSWPLQKIIITQYFGDTDFSTANPQIYSGHGHDGVDFGASIGTPVLAALGGEVVGVANTDSYPGCYSFGKWIMIKHPNGLSTLYAHLSVQGVQVGDTVQTGQIIGYSGNTGYTTGPHLHFGVYATQGVQITLFKTSLHCQGATIPLATLDAYLNPLSYLPALPSVSDQGPATLDQ